MMEVALDDAVGAYLQARGSSDLALLWNSRRKCGNAAHEVLAQVWANQRLSCDSDRSNDKGMLKLSRSKELARFECPHEGCNKFFSTKSNRNRHFREIHQHQQVLEFACETCGRTFVRKADLISHARSHSAEKPFTCEICQVSFKRSPDWRHHVLSKHGIMPFSCEFCTKRFSRKRLLRQHIQREHPHGHQLDNFTQPSCPSTPGLCGANHEGALQIPHDDHTDYLVGGALHHFKDGRCEHHGELVFGNFTIPQDVCVPVSPKLPDKSWIPIKHGDHLDFLVDGLLLYPNADGNCEIHGGLSFSESFHPAGEIPDALH